MAGAILTEAGNGIARSESHGSRVRRKVLFWIVLIFTESRPAGVAQNKKSVGAKGRRELEDERYGTVSDDSRGTATEDGHSSTNDSNDHTSRHRLRTAKRTVDKGKRKVRIHDQAMLRDALDEESPLPTDDEEAALLRGDWVKVSGPFPTAAKMAAVQLGRTTRFEAAKIARRFKKTPREVLIHAGLGVRSSRLSSNASNKFRSWYAAHNPKPKDSKSLVSFHSADPTHFSPQ